MTGVRPAFSSTACRPCTHDSFTTITTALLTPAPTVWSIERPTRSLLRIFALRALWDCSWISSTLTSTLDFATRRNHVGIFFVTRPVARFRYPILPVEGDFEQQWMVPQCKYSPRLAALCRSALCLLAVPPKVLTTYKSSGNVQLAYSQSPAQFHTQEL